MSDNKQEPVNRGESKRTDKPTTDSHKKSLADRRKEVLTEAFKNIDDTVKAGLEDEYGHQRHK